MELVINEENLTKEEVQEVTTKVRAILIDENNRILIANYGKVILLPGGSVDKEETITDAIIRELSEEIGITYQEEELEYLNTIKYFQKDYPKRDGTFKNRLVQTYYFIGRYKGISNINRNLTEKEEKDNFTLELVLLEELEKKILENQNNNPRNIYFQKELLLILGIYKDLNKPQYLLKRTLKQN